MRRAAFLLFTVLLLAVPKAWGGDLATDFSILYADVKGDMGAAYTDRGNYLKLGGAVLAAGLSANTAMDENFHAYYNGHIESGLTDSVADAAIIPGEALVTVPVLFGAYLASSGEVKGWARDSIRALAVGAPVGLGLQLLTGGQRPEEGGSGWRPFRDSNGLSGHAFIGAVPFLTAARRTDGPYLKPVLYGLSALPALSRINDDKHYLSQAALGWFLGYLSVESVGRKASTLSLGVDGPVVTVTLAY